MDFEDLSDAVFMVILDLIPIEMQLNHVQLVDKRWHQMVGKYLKKKVNCLRVNEETIRSFSSMMDFAKGNRRSHGTPCFDHEDITTQHFAVTGVTLVNRIPKMIRTNCLGIQHLRFHSVKFTLEGLKQLTQCDFWINSLRHLDVKDCSLDPPGVFKSTQEDLKHMKQLISDRDVYRIPSKLTEFELFLVTDYKFLLTVFKQLTHDLWIRHDKRRERRTRYRIRCPQNRGQMGDLHFDADPETSPD